MKVRVSLRAWNYGMAPAIAGASTATYFAIVNFAVGASLDSVASAFVVWFIRDFFLALMLAVPAAALMRVLGANPFWYWVSAFVTGIPMGFVLADPSMEWHPTEAQLEGGFQAHTMLIYALLFGFGAFTYGIRVGASAAHSKEPHAV